MKPIFLIGYMGCGKSTLARAVSRATGFDFIDLDAYIENRFHMSVNDIFASRGEAGFREIEGRLLREVGEFEDVIIACGGGTPCFADNMGYMNSHGTTVWLNASIERLHDRLIRGRHKRPLLAGKSNEELLATIVAGLETRRMFYSQAQMTFPSDLLEDRRQISKSTALFMQMTGLKPISQ